MATRFKLAIFIFLSALTLYGCGPMVTDDVGERVGSTEIREAAERGEVKELLGAPEEIENWEGGRIEAYYVHQGTRLFSPAYPIIPALVPAPYFSYYTIAYDANGSLIDIRQWPGIDFDSPKVAIESHFQSLADEEARAEARAEETRRLEEICEVSFAEAEKMGDEDQDDRFVRCSRHSEINRHSTAMWACLAANRGHPAGQNYLGRYFEDRHQASGLNSDLIEAYKWYSLAVEQRMGSDYHRGRVVSQLTPSELSKAKQMVTDWQPSPSECKSIPAMESSSARLN